MKGAMTKIRASLTNNVDLKVIAVIIAVIVWLAVVNISDPEKTIIIYNVPVTVTDENAITDLGMVYEVQSGRYVNITISGKRSMVSNLSSEDFSVTASLKELSKVNSVPIEISTKNKSIGRKITIVKQSLQSLIVSVEKVEKQVFPVEVEFVGKAAAGYSQGDYSLSNDTVNIKAPVSVLDRVYRVAAVCDLEGKDTDINQSVMLVLYDKRGQKIQNHNIKLSHKKVDIYVDILEVKEIPIVVGDIVIPSDEYQISEVKLSPNVIKISGDKETLDGIEKLDITEDIDVSSLTKNTTQEIDISKKLPEGILVNGENKIAVTIKVNKLVTKTYEIKTSDLKTENLKSEIDLKYLSKSFKVSIKAEKSVIDKISAEDFKVKIDLKGLDKGTITVPVILDIPENTDLLEEPTVKVRLK